MQIIQIPCDDLIFDCFVRGNKNDPLVILLHGFPQSGMMWTRLMEDLSNLGYYCLAPNLRGYSEGARPRGKKHYHIDDLTKDIKLIANAVGKDNSFHLIGHDWGSVIGWKLVQDYPDRIKTWISMSVPHIQAFFHAVMTDPEQMKKSRYISLFHWPLIPEWRLRKNDYAILRKMLKHSPGVETEHFISILKSKYGLTAALNYYRANKHLGVEAVNGSILSNIDLPTLFIWGEYDIAIGKTAVNNSHQFMTGYYKFLKISGGHFLIESRYEEIYPSIIEHLYLSK